jgi:branched-chain amino acid transport system substrate-binding protein
MDENTYNLCGNNWTGPTNPCVGRVIGLLPFAAYGDLRYPGMVDVIHVHDAARIKNGEDTTRFADFHYVQGYMNFWIWKTAVEKVVDANLPVTSPNLKAAFETFSEVDTGSITNPISFSATDHRPTTGANLYSISQYGTLNFEGDAHVQLRADWIGW